MAAGAAAAGFNVGATRAAQPGEITAAFPDLLQPGASDSIKAVFAQFEAAHPGVKVQGVGIPFAQYHAQMLTELKAGSPPDVLRADDPQLPLWIDQDFLEPLDPWLKDAGLDPNAFNFAQRDAQKDGKNYAALYITNPRVFLYNKALFSAAGIPIAPRNAGEFEADVKRLTNPDTRQFGFGLASKEGDTTGFFIQLMPIVIGMGGSFFDNGRPTATNPRVADALALVKRLWDGGAIPRGMDAVTVNTTFYQGKIASLVSGAFVAFQAIAAYPDVGRQMTAAPNPFPSPKAMRASAWWAVPRKARNKDLGAKLIVQMLQKPGQEGLVNLQGALTARPGMISGAYLQKYPWFHFVQAAGRNAVSYLPPGTGAKGFDALGVIGGSILDILYRGTAVNAAMSDLQGKLERMFPR